MLQEPTIVESYLGDRDKTDLMVDPRLERETLVGKSVVHGGCDKGYDASEAMDVAGHIFSSHFAGRDVGWEVMMAQSAQCWGGHMQTGLSSGR